MLSADKFLAHRTRIAISQQFSGERMHIPFDDLRRRAIPTGSSSRVEMIENAVQDRPRAGHAGDFMHRRAVEISRPTRRR